MKIFHTLLISFLAVIIIYISGCGSLQQDIDLQIPPFDRELNAECYLLPNSPIYVLFLTETVGYYDEFDLPVIEDATVSINYMGKTDVLEFSQPVINGDTLLPIPVYFGLRTSADNFDSLFTLRVTDPKGREITAQTKLKRPVPFLSHEIEFNDKGKAFVLSKVQDPGDEANFYRRILQLRIQTTQDNGMGGIDTVWRSRNEQDFSFSDEFQNGGIINLGTGFNYVKGDTLITSLYHIEEAYNTFLETTDGAIVANFSPFAQPTRVLTNIQGGTGIFTGLAFVTDTVIVE